MQLTLSDMQVLIPVVTGTQSEQQHACSKPFQVAGVKYILKEFSKFPGEEVTF